MVKHVNTFTLKACNQIDQTREWSGFRFTHTHTHGASNKKLRLYNENMEVLLLFCTIFIKTKQYMDQLQSQPQQEVFYDWTTTMTNQYRDWIRTPWRGLSSRRWSKFKIVLFFLPLYFPSFSKKFLKNKIIFNLHELHTECCYIDSQEPTTSQATRWQEWG